ncbi:hypothetical protein K2Q00_02445 [Patescibacteria group bacterium]|nr:hypothetical protein [Patescibacteria group bacterium]
MKIAATYARALFDLIEDPSNGSKKAATYLSNLDGVLKRRGHQRLLPRIFSEYQRLELSKQRSEKQQEVTEESERTRILLELYRKLTKTA